MTWTHSYAGHAADATNERLAEARDTFIEAQRALENAREHLLLAHAETARGWATR